MLALGIDWHVFGFTALLGVLTCLLFGIGPGHQGGRPGARHGHAAEAAARPGRRSAIGSAARWSSRRSRSRSSCSSVRCCSVRRLRNLLRIDPGHRARRRPRRRCRRAASPTRPRTSPGRVRSRCRSGSPRSRVCRAWRRCSSARSAATAGTTPCTREGSGASTEGKKSWFNRVGPGYFRTLKTPLLAGRDFDRRDTADAPRVAIVNEEFARIFFGGRNPVGRTFRVEAGAGKPEPVYQIVGLVRNTKYDGLREESGRSPSCRWPRTTTTRTSSPSWSARRRRSARRWQASGGVMSDLQSGMLVEFRVLELQVARSVQRERLMASVSGAFGVLATLLSTLGLYGVMSYMVARRRNEIGVRVALGASARDVIRLVLTEAGRLVVVGLVIGAGVSLRARALRGIAAVRPEARRCDHVGVRVPAAVGDGGRGESAAGPSCAETRSGSGPSGRVAIFAGCCATNRRPDALPGDGPDDRRLG